MGARTANTVTYSFECRSVNRYPSIHHALENAFPGTENSVLSGAWTSKCAFALKDHSGPEECKCVEKIDKT
ncbi:hypothetical protein VTN00DRAFT_6713 [Thermoascus crustaceus]|uniref:uncharacterized protein n=1 Tax=Thermoascus crustaceus TaxID=5088 RepID=UPI0037435B1B